MMICLNCGQENDDREKYCIYCHAKLKKTSQVDLIDEDEDVPVSPGNDPSLQVRTHNSLVIVVILCIAIGVTGWFLLKGNANDSAIIDLQGWVYRWFHSEQSSVPSSPGSNDLEWEDQSSISEYPEQSELPNGGDNPGSDEGSHDESAEHGEESIISSEPGKEEQCTHSTYVYLDEYDHRCSRCGHLEEHIWYVDNDAVYCRRCDTLKEYITHEESGPEDPQYQRLMTVIITGNYLNIRSGPAEEYPMLSDESIYYRHQYVDIYEISYDGMWGRVRWNGMDGWIYLFYTNGLNEMG